MIISGACHFSPNIWLPTDISSISGCCWMSKHTANYSRNESDLSLCVCRWIFYQIKPNAVVCWYYVNKTKRNLLRWNGETTWKTRAQIWGPRDDDNLFTHFLSPKKVYVSLLQFNKNLPTPSSRSAKDEGIWLASRNNLGAHFQDNSTEFCFIFIFMEHWKQLA